MQRVGHASAGGALWSRLLRSQAGLRGRGGLEGVRAEASGGQSGPRPVSPHPVSTGPGPQAPGPPDPPRLGGKGAQPPAPPAPDRLRLPPPPASFQERRPGGEPALASSDPTPLAGCPAACHYRPTWNVCHVVLKLPGGEACPQAKGLPPTPEPGCSKESGRSAGSPSPSLAGGWGREGPVPSGSGSRRIRNLFSSRPGTTSFRPRRPDPRSGVRIKDRL